MAGYVILIDRETNIEQIVKNGIYSTKLLPAKNQEKKGWNRAKEGTFADYLSMHEGDHIYFFTNRMIYGIGELVNINGDCKYLSYLEADNPHTPSREEYESKGPLIPFYDSSNRCFCVFRPSPLFFKKGVDMDEVLGSNPALFRMLRVMWKVSFIKVDESEDEALIDIILRRNETHLSTKEAFKFESTLHDQLCSKNLNRYVFTHTNIARQAAEVDGKVKHEMVLELSLCDILSNQLNIEPFGHFDYVSHQVVASPMKPVDYMDKMDIFGYRKICGYNVISKYIILELKKDTVDDSYVVGQIMKYVDYVTKEYAHGDYGMIEAFIVAFGFTEECIEQCREMRTRNYISSLRPPVSRVWKGLKLVKYSYSEGRFRFNEVIV